MPRISIRLYLLLFVLVFTGCNTNATDAAQAGTLEFSERNGKYTRVIFESRTRGQVPLIVYLPPDWTSDGTETYPLLFFLHGQHQDERTFPFSVPASQLNGWISGQQIPPLVIIAIRGSDDRENIQWYTADNEELLTSETTGELRAYCRNEFRAGLDSQTISIQGFSRGASGTLYYALNFPEKFASAIANAFVSDYVLSERKASALKNKNRLISNGIYIRLMVGSQDEYERRAGRRGTHLLHRYLLELNIPHEYEVLQGVPHDFRQLWHYQRPDDLLNGLYELRCHALAWEKGKR